MYVFMKRWKVMIDLILSNALEEFLRIKKVSGLADKSLINYRSFINPFIIFANNCCTEVLRYDHIIEYIDYLQCRSITKTTVATYMRHLKVFFRWIENLYGLPFSAKNIIIPRMPKKNVYVYTDDEIIQIFNTVSADKDWIVVRNRAIISLMLDSGLRQKEVCELERKNIDFSRKIITVHGKGDKERVVPMGLLTLKFLKHYFRLCPYEISKYIFMGRDGDVITCNAIKLFMTKLSNKLPFEFSSHKLRHNFATNYCLDQYRQYGHVDIYRLQILLGHEDVATTQRYLHIANQILASQSSISHLDSIYQLSG